MLAIDYFPLNKMSSYRYKHLSTLKVWQGKEYLHRFIVLSEKILINYKGKSLTTQWRMLADTTSSKLPSEQQQYWDKLKPLPPKGCNKSTAFNSLIFPTKDA